jgi:mannose/cellobiose epimerase-like protein (N-acyl-D-glucosamine 2-epimerase family)
MAQSAYVFLVDHMRDPADGLWYNSITREGKMADSRKLLYGHWFVLYSFR